MYKVFYNQRTVFFIEKDFNIIDQGDSDTHFLKNNQQLKIVINEFLEKANLNKLYIICNDSDSVFKELIKQYLVIEAAGGLVRNKKDEILVIYRRGIWDLPKGKIEKNEPPQYAAVREVEEECGINNIELGGILSTTYHTYELNGKEILKRTFWYNMCHGGNQNPVPQIEEEITEAKWLNTNNINEVIKNTFPSIIDVLEKADIF